jgi:hypothetical protein
MTLPSVLRRNLALKVTSIVLGILVYLHVDTDRMHETKLWLPLTFSGLPDTLAIAGPAPARAQVLLRGRGKELLKLRWRAPVVEVDLTGAASGRFNHSLSVADVRMSPTSEAAPVAILEPRLITLELDRFATRSVPVALRFTGGLPPGYLLAETRVTPARISIRGPSRLLPQMDSLEVGPVDLRSVRGRAEGEFPVQLPSPGLTPTPARVRVDLEVERLVTRELDQVPVRVQSDPALVGRATPDRAQVQISGTLATTQGLDTSDLTVVVDARGLGPGLHELPGQVDTVGGVILTPVPERFRVRLER